jgi:hypothetical protein
MTLGYICFNNRTPQIIESYVDLVLHYGGLRLDRCPFECVAEHSLSESTIETSLQGSSLQVINLDKVVIFVEDD